MYRVGNSGIIGNGKIIALCLDKQIYLFENYYLRDCAISTHSDCIDYICPNGWKKEKIPICRRCTFDISLDGDNIMHIEDEPGLIQRLLTKDMTTRQMIRLVREKLDK